MRAIWRKSRNSSTSWYVVMGYAPHNISYFSWAMDMEDFLPGPGSERGVRGGRVYGGERRVSKERAELGEGWVR